MSELPQDMLREHEYDGIQEYDNPTPGWWTGIFVVSCIFAAVYFLYYHMTLPGRTLAAAYDVAVSENLRLQFAEIGELQGDEATLLKFMSPANAEWMKVGEVVFKAQCQTCHGADGQGLSCPNLTDDHYKNIKKLADLPGVIADGAANGAMPAWKHRLHPNEIVLVACYVAKKRGQNLPSTRAAEGDVIPPWPEPPADAAPAGAAADAADAPAGGGDATSRP